MDRQNTRSARVPPCRPHGEDERKPGPFLPRFAEVHPHGIPPLRPQQQRRIADHENRLVRQSGQTLQVSRLRPGRREVGAHAPAMTAEQVEQQYRRAGGRRDQDGAVVQLRQRPPGEERHAVDRAVRGDGEVRQQMVLRGVPRVLHGGNDADLELARGEQVVELGRRSGDQLGGHAHQPAVDRAVDRIAVDPGDAAELHAACTTGSDAPRRRPGSGGGSSNCSRTGWYRLSRSTGRFPAPRIRRTSSR